jgi:hypothetical protein
MDDGIELASLTAAFEAIRDMLARPFSEDMHKPTPNPGWDVGVLFDHVMDLTVRIGPQQESSSTTTSKQRRNSASRRLLGPSSRGGADAKCRARSSGGRDDWLTRPRSMC